MKKLLYTFTLIIVSISASSQGLEYFLPKNISYDPVVPTPKDIIHHEVGEYHVTHDRLVNYMKALANAVPSRVKLETMGFTYEKRPQVLLIITSPKNHARLEEIRKQHLLLSDPSQSRNVNIDNMPIVVWIGHSIHGNEASGSNAALVSAYYLAAAKGNYIDDLLENTVILFDPSFNPDGLQRFSTWVNQHKSNTLVTDPNSREFNEVWPGGRYNHYWFDLNRDWLPAVHVESQNRLEWFHKWKPNILTDHHEQGSNATFFFQPGVPSRVNPLTPEKNQELTAKLGKFHGKFLDSIGSLYFTKENYDDFYYGKGSTYPDINGAVGILFEQASSRGHLQETANGLLSFPFAIKNQFVTTLSTLEGARHHRKEFLQWQRDFYADAMQEAAKNSIKGYVFSSTDDVISNEFLTMLGRHQIEVRTFKNPLTIEGNKYQPGNSFAVLLNQPQMKLIQTIFSKTSTYRDSLFYDITTWTMPLAFGFNANEINASQVNEAGLLNDFNNNPIPGTPTIQRSDVAYLMEWDQFESPAALHAILSGDLMAKVATNNFGLTIGGKEEMFAAGTILVPVRMQSKDTEAIYLLLNEIVKKYKVKIHSVQSGSANAGSDLGSSSFLPLTKPSVALITGSGVNALEAGEVWHLLDQRMKMPLTHLDVNVFNRSNIERYNTIIMVGGNYGELGKEKMKTWVEEGGTLILIGDAVNWGIRSEISKAVLKKDDSKVERDIQPYSKRSQVEGAQQLRGAIFEASLDLTHPLAYGYGKNKVTLFKANKVFLEKSKNPFATPFYYENKPLQSGWVSRENLEMVRNSASVVVNSVGGGRVINLADNPNFRAFWLGGTKLFMNSIFFGRTITAASAR